QMETAFRRARESQTKRASRAQSRTTQALLWQVKPAPQHVEPHMARSSLHLQMPVTHDDPWAHMMLHPPQLALSVLVSAVAQLVLFPGAAAANWLHTIHRLVCMTAMPVREGEMSYLRGGERLRRIASFRVSVQRQRPATGVV